MKKFTSIINKRKILLSIGLVTILTFSVGNIELIEAKELDDTPVINPLFGPKVLVDSNKTFNMGQHPSFKNVYRRASSYTFNTTSRISLSANYSRGPLTISVAGGGSGGNWTVNVPYPSRKSIPIMYLKGDVYREETNTRDIYSFKKESEWVKFIYE